MISGKKIFITGGAGFLGRNIIKRYYDKNEIVVYSRDEAKHYYLKKEFPNIECVVGDVRNFDLMKIASKGCNIGIFATSLKQIESVDQNPDESVEIIIKGAINSRRCAEENEFESACFISSDKSRSATTLYGSMKFVAGELFIVNAEKYLKDKSFIQPTIETLSKYDLLNHIKNEFNPDSKSHINKIAHEKSQNKSLSTTLVVPTIEKMISELREWRDKK